MSTLYLILQLRNVIDPLDGQLFRSNRLHSVLRED
ncbi:unnamed protein product [Larinioides sclopetarius]|uniref:Uncharacterized protein n=1 Tax=Larinioides sclopetarius TaxID=280406 RepID=A0AAV2B2Y7_9ARAC